MAGRPKKPKQEILEPKKVLTKRGTLVTMGPEFQRNKWQKGQSGNPKGSSQLDSRIRAICQKMTVPGAVKLGSLAMDQPFDERGNLLEPGTKAYEESGYVPHRDERVSVAALGMLFDRAWGKPKAEEFEEPERPRPNLKLLSEKDKKTLYKLVLSMLPDGTREEYEEDDE